VSPSALYWAILRRAFGFGLPYAYEGNGKSALFRDRHKGTVMSFGIYVVGFLILIGGLIYGAVLLHIAPQWIAVGAIVLLGLAVLKGVQATRGKDPSV
jgi:hypothetical protein